jgi:uncharacterized membrane protein
MFVTDLGNIIIWWVLFFMIGLSVYPTTHLLFKKFFDAGYGFSKTIGLLLLSYLFFLINIFHLAPFGQLAIASTFLLIITLNTFLLYKNKKGVLATLREKKRIFIAQEFIFAFGLVLWSVVRAHQPNIEGLEKFMDYGFINSILRSKYLPPSDMWYSGGLINYYWFGHYMVAVATKLSSIPSNITYNLMLATIMGSTLTGAFSISTTLTQSLGKIVNKKTVVAAGLISAILLAFGGNFHTPFYTLKENPDNYWYPDATRFIGYNPDVNDKTIHEFPMYSFVVSDLHAHLINLPVVLVYVGVLLWIFTKNKNKISIATTIPLGVLLGTMFMTNAWDTGNYLLLTGLCIIVFNTHKFGLKPKTIFETAKTIVPIVFIAAITVSPFLIHFESIAEGVDYVMAHSRLWQLAILWGFPFILTLLFFWSMRKQRIRNEDLLVTGMFITVWALIVIPEFFYVKDIYIASHHRANTMFKLTYQAFVMSYTLAGFVAVKIISSEKTVKIKYSKKIIFFALFAALLIYPKFAIGGYYNDLKVYKGLKGDTWLAEQHPDTYNVVQWFNTNISGQPTILEAPGDSYTTNNVISSYTGLPTVSGWFVHEWLWRGDSSFPQARVSDINLIYTSNDISLTKALLQKYAVEYIIVGHFEREKYPNLYETKFNQLGKMIYSSGSTNVYKIN